MEQCAGELCYTDDIPPVPDELHAAPVLTTVANGTIGYVKPTWRRADTHRLVLDVCHDAVYAARAPAR